MSEKLFTQDEVNALVGKARTEGRDSKAKEFEGWISPDDFKSKTAELNTQLSDLTSALNKANETIEENKTTLAENEKNLKAYELHSVKTQIAHEKGLSYEAIDFLQGETKEDIEKNADVLKSLVGNNNRPPVVDYEKPPTDNVTEALMKMSRDLNRGE